MRIQVKTFGPIRRELGSKRLEVEVPQEASIDSVINELVKLYGEKIRHLILDSEGISGNLIILLNMKEINRLSGLDTQVSEGDTITILPHIQGG